MQRVEYGTERTCQCIGPVPLESQQRSSTFAMQAGRNAQNVILMRVRYTIHDPLCDGCVGWIVRGRRMEVNLGSSPKKKHAVRRRSRRY